MFLSIHWWKHVTRSRVDHVIESLNFESSYSRSFVSINFKESYLFHSLNLEVCSSLIKWDRIDIVKKWIDTDQSLHLDTNRKTIKQSAKNELWLMIYSFESHRSFLFVMKSEIIFRDFFLYLIQIFIFINLLSLFAARKRIEFKRFILLNLVSIKFVSLRSQSNLDSRIFRKSLNFTMTSNSESQNRSEERRIIITNKKNENLKKEHLMRRIIN
jgi:hypothetical protein